MLQIRVTNNRRRGCNVWLVNSDKKYKRMLNRTPLPYIKADQLAYSTVLAIGGYWDWNNNRWSDVWELQSYGQ